MKVTELRLKEMEDKGKLKAIGSITLDDAFVVSGVGVVEGSKGLFVSFPSYKGNDGKYHDMAYPLSKELRETIQQAVMEEFRKNRALDEMIEIVELRTEERRGWNQPFEIGFEEPVKEAPNQEKASFKDKLKTATERVSSQISKNNEKMKEEVSL